MTVLHVGAIWLAVIALALRTWRGLHQIVKSCLSELSDRLVAIQLRFDQAPSQTARMAIAMVELEELISTKWGTPEVE